MNAKEICKNYYINISQRNLALIKLLNNFLIFQCKNREMMYSVNYIEFY